MYGAWDALKNVRKKYPTHQLAWAAYVAGKRESRRLLGDLILAKKDLIDGTQYADGCVPTGWRIDLHLADKRYEDGFGADAFLSEAQFGKYKQPYWIPYRCLYSRNVPNLLMAGRNISATHLAFASTRVMATCAVMGQAAGTAAVLCCRDNCQPRAINVPKLQEALI